MTVVCTNNAEEPETAWLRQSSNQTILYINMCLQNLYNYSTQKRYKDVVTTEFCSLQNVTGTKSQLNI